MNRLALGVSAFLLLTAVFMGTGACAAGVDFWFAKVGDAAGTPISDINVPVGAPFSVSVWYKVDSDWAHNAVELLIGYDETTTKGSSAVPTPLGKITATEPAASNFDAVWPINLANTLGGGNGTGTRPYGVHIARGAALGSSLTGTTARRICDVTLNNAMPASQSHQITIWNDAASSTGWTSFIVENTNTLQDSPAATLTVHSIANATPITIASAKKLEDGASVTCNGVIVTAVFGDRFYVEDTDRTSGIMVKRTSHGMFVGYKASVSGTMASDQSTNERYIDATSGSVSGTPDTQLDPLAMINKALAGGNYYYQAGPPTSGQIGTADGIGLNNVGLLVRTVGRASAADATGFSLDDGSGAVVRVQVSNGTQYGNKYVVATGICSLDASGGRLLKTRSNNDVQIIQ